MQDNLTFSQQQQADWAEQELREQKQLLQDLNPPLTNLDELKQWYDKNKPIHCDCPEWDDRCTFCQMVIKCHNQLEDNIRAKENAEEDARVKAYKEKLIPLSPEGWCPHCSEAFMNKNGNNDCDYNTYYDGLTGVDLHTHETTEHKILAVPTETWEKSFDVYGDAKAYTSRSSFKVLATKMVTNGHCEACLDGLNDLDSRDEDMSQWYDEDTSNHVYTCVNGHNFNDDDDFCYKCI